MDAKYFKILSFLYTIGIGEYENISPILLELYPGVDRMDYDRAMIESRNIIQLLENLRENKLLQFQPFSIGSGNRTGGVAWIDSVKIYASITQIGKDSIDAENEKGISTRLMESTLLTNESVRETNSATIRNIHFQRKSQVWTIMLGALSTVFILITVFQSITNETEKTLKGIQQSINAQSKTIQNLNETIKQINNTINKQKIDSIKNKHKN